jgi:hypothetical protein
MADLDLDVNTTDPEALAKVFEQIESGQDLQTIDTKTEAATSQTPQAESAGTSKEQQAAQGQTDQDDDGAAGVATKDGKHVIPYSVLKSERERATRAEQLAQEMRERVEALEAMVKSGNQGANNGESARTDQQQPAAAEQLSQEDLESLKEDFPTVYKAVMASMAKAQALEAKLQPVEESVRNAQEDQARTAADTVQDAIDSIPKLSHIQANDPEAFELAKQFDATLRTQKSWASKSLAERFQKVSEMVEAAIGPIEVPGAKPTASQPSAEELRKAAIAKASSATKRDVPTSLSEFPAGQAPATDERAAAEQLSPLQLAEKFSKMSSEDMDAYFRAL